MQSFREHHDGLLFVWKIRQGLNNHTSIERLKDYTGWYWRNHIRPHFFQEEKVLTAYIPGHSLVIRMKKEHEDIRELILTIDKEADRNDFLILANLVEGHIRFEERELFQYCEEHFSSDELNSAYNQLEKHPVTCHEEWNDDFWVKKETK